MIPVAETFDFDFFGRDIVYGRGRAADLGSILDGKGLQRALIVCGSNVGANRALMDPIRDGLGDHLVGVFDETTPDKSIETIFDGIDVMRDLDPDVLIGVGGGSSLDVARQMSVFETAGRSLSDLREAARADRLDPPKPDDPTDVIVIPTTFAGADLSNGGSIAVLTADESPTGQPIITKGSVWPTAMVYDPNLFETTPMGALAGSAMNGFDKGIETIYARSATPIRDATSIHGLRLLHEGFPALGDDDPGAMDRSVLGMILVQLHRKINIVHAFGHGFARRYPVQQGHVHAVLVPHVLRFLFEKIDANRRLIADGLDVDTTDRSDQELADAVVEEVTRVRDSFDLPTRLRDLDVVDRDDFPAIAAFILRDPLMPETPAALDPSAEEIESVLHSAW